MQAAENDFCTWKKVTDAKGEQRSMYKLTKSDLILIIF
jgi:hypothetical protein